MNLNEVSPPGWGHTKAEKEKTKPWKPKSKIGGTAAAFKRALDDGRFKGLPGSKTKKEKTADMFKLMWSMKKKGDKPHYKPGTDKKYKKYQEEEVSRRSKPSAIAKKKKLEKLLIDKEVNKIQKEGTSMPYVSTEDKKAIDKRAKNLFKKDLKGTHDSVNEAAGGGVPLSPQELEIQKKMARLNVRLARKRSQALNKAKTKDTETAPEQVKEGSLRKWFKGSKSKDGKGGWVNVVTGGTCASDEPGEGTPKCVSSSKRASMTKAERLSASRRKKAADPGQQQKTGAAKPTYVRTDSKKKMKEDVEYTYPNVRRNPRFSTGSKMSMKPATGIGAKKSTKNNPDGDDIRNATYNQIKKLERKKAAQKRKTASRIVGIKKMKEETAMQDNNLYGDAYAGLKKKIGSKKKHDKPAIEEGIMKMVKRAVKKKEERKPQKAMDAGARLRRKVERKVHAKYVSGSEDLVPDNIRDHVEYNEAKEVKLETKKNCGCGQDPCVTYGNKELTQVQKVKEGVALDAYNKITNKEKRDKMKKELATLTKRAKAMKKHGSGYHPMLHGEEIVTEADPRLAIYQSGMTDASRVKGRVGKAVDKVKDKVKKVLGKKDKVSSHLDRYRFQSGMDNYLKSKVKKEERELDERTLSSYIPSDRQGEARRANLDYTKAQLKKKEDQSTKNRGDLSKRDAGKMAKERLRTKKIMSLGEEDKKGKGSGTKDACYHKVKASAKVWPSAYASGRLVQCRKKGAANYGKSKSEGFEGWADNTILEKTAAWTRKEGKNKEGGLNEKGRKSYEKANPGSDLKAPQPEGGSRKKSFCARMGGMKKKLTSAKTANDPDSRINKALRKWKC